MARKRKADQAEVLEEDLLGDNTEEEKSTPETAAVGEGEQAEEKGTGAAEPAKIKVGETEYAPDELTKLVEKAKRVSSIEKEQNIDIEKLYPDYTRKSQILSDPLKLGAYAAEKFGASKMLSPEQQVRQQALKEAREVYGILTKEDLEEFKKGFKEELKVDSLLDDVTEIEKEKGIAKTDLLDFMKATKITDPYDASNKILEYRQMSKGDTTKTNPTFTERSGSSGVHVPSAKKVPSMNDVQAFGDAIREGLSTPGSEEV